LSWLLSDIESVFGAVATAFKDVASTISNIPSAVTNFFGSIGSAIFAGLSALGNFFYRAWKAFVDGIMSVGGWLYSALDRIAHFFEWLWDNIARFFAWLAQVIWNALVTFAHWIVDAFSSIGKFIVQHVNQVIHSIDPSFYGLWCNFRNKLQAVVTANVAEVLVYKSIESAAEGRIPLRGLGDWIWFAARILGAPIAGQLAAAVLDMVLPRCGTPTASFFGQFTLPTLPTFTLPPAPSLVITPPSFISPVPSPTSLTYDIAYATTFSIGIPSLVTSLDVSFTYSILLPLSPFATFPLSVLFTYAVVPPLMIVPDFPAAFSTCSFDPGSAARYLMFLVQEGSPGVAYNYIQQVLTNCGPDKVQAVLHAAADQYFFREMIKLFTFNQPSLTTGATIMPPAFFSTIDAPVTLADCVRCTPVLVADYVGSTSITAGVFTMTPPGAAPGVNDGAPGTSGIVLVADSLLGPVTLNANGLNSYGVKTTSISVYGYASPQYDNPSSSVVPFSVYSPYAGGYWWISPYTPPAAGQGACWYGGCGFIGAGGGGGGQPWTNTAEGGWFFNTSSGRCYINPNNSSVVATPYLAFPDGQSMAVALMKAVSDLWLMYVLKVTPSAIAPMPVVGGGAGGGGGGPYDSQVYGPGAGSAGEVIVLAMKYAPLTVNAAGGSAGCVNALEGGGGGAGGYVVVLVPEGQTVSVSADVSGGSPCTANSWNCGFVGQPGQNGVVLTPTVTIGEPSTVYPSFALGVSFTYVVALPVSASWANALGVSFTYVAALPVSASWANALGVSFTYGHVSPLSVSWTNALGVSFSHSP
jgi:hypothetical protein